VNRLIRFSVLLSVVLYFGCQSFGLGGARGRVEYVTIPSPSGVSDAGDRTMAVYLPPEYDETTGNYPLLILLHDFREGDHQSFLGAGYPGFDKAVGTVRIDRMADALIIDGRAKPMIIAMPDYAHIYDERMPYQRYVVETVLPYLQTNFRVSPDRDRTAIGGHAWSATDSYESAMKNESSWGVAVMYGLCSANAPIKMIIERDYDSSNPVSFHFYFAEIDTDMGFGFRCKSDLARRYAAVLKDLGAEVHETDYEGEHWDALPAQVEQSLIDVFN